MLKKARGLPVTSMVRLSLEQTVERYTRRSKKAQQLLEQDELWTERFKMKWEKTMKVQKGTLFFIEIYPQGYLRLDLFKLMVLVVILIVFH